MTDTMEQYLLQSQEDIKALIRQLCAIPAPSHHEENRAAFCREWFEKAGGEGVYIDEAWNVICPYNVTENNPVVVFMAHTDTVFPDTEPMPFRETGDFFYSPGVCDDTGNLAVMMVCARYFLQNKLPAKTGILFVANSCEEGLGNLKGCRAVVDAFGKRIQALVSFDGATLNGMIAKAVGSHRYRITVKTEGGHSFSKFGNRNAIAYLSSMITTLYGVKVPEEDGSKTTYNVGCISGGTSVNTIAQEAQMLYEYRSDNKNCLARMEIMLQSVISAYQAMGITVECERIGERPCTGDVDPARQEALLAAANDVILAATGQPGQRRSGSTDCNIPLSVGIPSTCVGVCVGYGCHTREESLELGSLLPGSRLCMDFIRKFFN